MFPGVGAAASHAGLNLHSLVTVHQ